MPLIKLREDSHFDLPGLHRTTVFVRQVGGFVLLHAVDGPKGERLKASCTSR